MDGNGLALFFSPAAEVLVQIKGRGAISPLYIRQPFGYNVQKSRIQADGCSDESDHYPSLPGIV
jgi:hypothetical protein